MYIFFVYLVDEFYLFLRESFKGTPLEADGICECFVVCLRNVASFEKKGEKLFDEEDCGGFRVERIWVDEYDIFSPFAECFKMVVGVAGMEDK